MKIRKLVLAYIQKIFEDKRKDHQKIKIIYALITMLNCLKEVFLHGNSSVIRASTTSLGTKKQRLMEKSKLMKLVSTQSIHFFIIIY